jgi:hypothetical protein
MKKSLLRLLLLSLGEYFARHRRGVKKTSGLCSGVPPGVSVLAAMFGALLPAGCSLPQGEDWIEAQGTTPDPPGVVIDYNLQTYVPVPVMGAVPVQSLKRGDLEISVDWMDAEGQTPAESGLGAFEQGAVYQARITLSAKNRHAFDPEIPFAYSEWMVKRQDESRDREAEGKRFVTVTYYEASGVTPPEPEAEPEPEPVPEPEPEPEPEIVIPFGPEGELNRKGFGYEEA